jgi:hypothetical protein
MLNVVLCPSSQSHSSSHHLGLKLIKVLSCSLVILLLLFGDIHINPSPSSNTFQVCTLNIHSLLNPLEYMAIAILAESHQIDLFALTDTWITSSSSSPELFNATPPGITLISCPRPTPATKFYIVGGGTAFLIREPASLLSAPTQTFQSFQISAITLKLSRSNLTIFNVYQPPPVTTKSRKPVPFSDFLTGLDTFLFKPPNPWSTPTLSELKSACRHLQRI